MGPFGQPVAHLALRHHLVPHGVMPDAMVDKVRPLPGEPGFEFQLGTAAYRYSRLGVERLREDEEERSHHA